MDLKYCPRCGADLEPDTRFCSSCGADLRERRPIAGGEPPKTTIVAPPQQTPTVAPTYAQAPQQLATPGITYASFGQRFWAILIDFIILLIPGLIFTFTLDFPWDTLLIGVVSLFYFWLLEAYNNGQTIGKIALKLRTVDEQTYQIATIGNYFVNNIFKIHPILFIIDFIIGILVNSGDPQKRLRLMQNASHTVVIRENN
jgi:uncharacterized RDD family membrane protein YckC